MDEASVAVPLVLMLSALESLSSPELDVDDDPSDEDESLRFSEGVILRTGAGPATDIAAAWNDSTLVVDKSVTGAEISERETGLPTRWLDARPSLTSSEASFDLTSFDLLRREVKARLRDDF